MTAPRAAGSAATNIPCSWPRRCCWSRSCAPIPNWDRRSGWRWSRRCGRSFRSADDELSRLVELAEQTARTASDFHQFTSVINDGFRQEQKIRIVEYMWQVAYSDGHLDAHENHLISKVAGLLHVTHGEYIAAKLRAKESQALVYSPVN